MRGERPRTVAMLAKAAPDAVGKRDASGLTPFHWLWVRFASTLLSLDDDRRGVGEATISKTTHMPLPYKTNRYNNFTSIEQGDFDSDLQLFKRLDPPTDFLHMRNIPREVADSEIGLRCAKRAVSVLQRIRTRRFSRSTCEGEIWTRQEAVMGLFWTKCVSLLEASVTAGQEAAPLEDADSFRLVHSAFVSECCLPTVAYIAASLFPEELRIRDELGRLPIHCAASRSWHAREWPPIDSGPAARLLQGESLNSFRVAFDLTPNEAIRVVDKDNRLVLHLLIDNLVKACCQIAQANNVDLLEDTLQMLRDVVRSYPDSLQRRDGRSMLYPFMQVSAAANEFKQPSTACDELALTMTYELLRENPAVMLGS